jgi:hypothetical protein
MLALVLCMLPVRLWARDPAINYMMECQGCHLADGSGGLQNIPALTNEVALFLMVPGGREYLVQVPGVASSSLSDREITDVLNWMLNEFGPVEVAEQYPPYTTAEEGVLRKQPLSEIAHKRAALVRLMQAREIQE